MIYQKLWYPSSTFLFKIQIYFTKGARIQSILRCNYYDSVLGCSPMVIWENNQLFSCSLLVLGSVASSIDFILNLMVIYQPFFFHASRIDDKNDIVNCNGCFCNVGGQNNFPYTLWRVTGVRFSNVEVQKRFPN
jgi:hypothetical protein